MKLPYMANGVIKLRILRGGSYSGFFIWALTATTCILMRDRQRAFWNTETLQGETHREEVNVALEAETGVT